MTLAGILLIDLVIVAFVAWILRLVYRNRLYVGYGVLLVAALTGLGVVASVPALRQALDGALSWLFGPAGPLVVSLTVLTLLLVYVFTQVTILSNRLVTLVQDLAIREADAPGKDGPPRGDELNRVVEGGPTPSSRRTG